MVHRAQDNRDRPEGQGRNSLTRSIRGALVAAQIARSATVMRAPNGNYGLVVRGERPCP
jgi:hypothetical protein